MPLFGAANTSTDDDLRERVARAICAAEGVDPDKPVQGWGRSVIRGQRGACACASRRRARGRGQRNRAAHPAAVTGRSRRFGIRPRFGRCGPDRLDQRAERIIERIRATQGARWGAIRQHGLLGDTVVVSDDAGQFRVGTHALCWVHAERLVHKLLPVTEAQRRAVDLVRQLIWWFYRDLKAWQYQPDRRRAAASAGTLRAQLQAPYRLCDVDRLLARLRERKAELLRVLDRPEIPLHTNGSENDIRAHVTKRKISGGTQSEAGRVARDVLLGLMKTCAKLGLSFLAYLGDCLGVPGAAANRPLAQLVRASAPA